MVYTSRATKNRLGKHRFDPLFNAAALLQTATLP
jgi:hypothetical protein